MPFASVPSNSSDLDRMLAPWRNAPGLVFYWSPCGSPRNRFQDRVTGLVGRPMNGLTVDQSGIVNNVAHSTQHIRWDTNLGFGASRAFAVMMVVASDLESAGISWTGGCFLKIGDSSTGIGFGRGNTTFEDDGNKLVALREALAWHAGTAGWQKGVNVLTYGWRSDTYVKMGNLTTGTGDGPPGSVYNAPTSQLCIGGYVANRGSGDAVVACAIYDLSMNATEFDAWSNDLYARVSGIDKLPTQAVRRFASRLAEQ